MYAFQFVTVLLETFLLVATVLLKTFLSTVNYCCIEAFNLHVSTVNSLTNQGEVLVIQNHHRDQTTIAHQIPNNEIENIDDCPVHINQTAFLQNTYKPITIVIGQGQK